MVGVRFLLFTSAAVLFMMMMMAVQARDDPNKGQFVKPYVVDDAFKGWLENNSHLVERGGKHRRAVVKPPSKNASSRQNRSGRVVKPQIVPKWLQKLSSPDGRKRLGGKYLNKRNAKDASFTPRSSRDDSSLNHNTGRKDSVTAALGTEAQQKARVIANKNPKEQQSDHQPRLIANKNPKSDALINSLKSNPLFASKLKKAAKQQRDADAHNAKEAAKKLAADKAAEEAEAKRLKETRPTPPPGVVFGKGPPLPPPLPPPSGGLSGSGVKAVETKKMKANLSPPKNIDMVSALMKNPMFADRKKLAEAGNRDIVAHYAAEKLAAEAAAKAKKKNPEPISALKLGPQRIPLPPPLPPPGWRLRG